MTQELSLAPSLSQRSAGMFSHHALAEAHFQCASNPFDKGVSPEGYINLGTAENYRLWNKLRRLLETTQTSLSKDDSFYQSSLHGKKELRFQVARWLSQWGHVDPEELTISSGVTSVIESLAFSLCDPGDVILVQAPAYTGFFYDLTLRTGASAIPVCGQTKNNFQLQPRDFEQPLYELRKQGKKVKGILLHNPANPTGQVFKNQLLQEFAEWTKQECLHLVVDEINAGSLHEGEHVSALTLNHNHIHTLYGFSKDFALSGWSAGVFHSRNPEVLETMKTQAFFSRVPNPVQTILTALLKRDKEITDLVDANMRDLKETCRHWSKSLKGIGIKHLQPMGGLSLFCDLSPWLPGPDFSGEMELCQQLMEEMRLNISPGQFFHCAEPGWFRICFAQADDVIQESIHRLMSFAHHK